MAEQPTPADFPNVAALDATKQAATPQPFFSRVLAEHLRASPTTLPVMAEDFDPTEHPNLQLALDAYLAMRNRSARVIGIVAEHKRHMGLGLADLLAPPRGYGSGPTEGPVEWVNIKLDGERVLPCIQSGLSLIEDGDQRLAALVSGPVEHTPFRRVRVEVIAPQREVAERFLADLRRLVRERNVYRGHILSLTIDMYGQLDQRFHEIPNIERDQIILPAGVLERAERHTLGFARQRERLLAAGQHLKRGLLLHGPPGTGKTLTAMYLANQMRDRTILLLTGRSLGLIQRSCAMARVLQPSMVILEDVDLVAEERTRPTANSGPLLFELLNEMDGLAEDVDIIFLLTTNRPDLLEPALASRPGRIDQAIEVPPPDDESRRKLLALYSRGLDVRVDDWDHLVNRTGGVSAAFIRELIRKAALFAADERDDALIIEDRHLDEALHELLFAGGDLTRSLLGASKTTDTSASA